VTRLALARVREILTFPLPRGARGAGIAPARGAISPCRGPPGWEATSAHGRPYAACRGNRGNRGIWDRAL